MARAADEDAVVEYEHWEATLIRQGYMKTITVI
jgi:hypothetical protein